MSPPGRALSRIRILDLADEAGAYCAKLLADMGAEVITIEPPGGKAMRRIGPFHGGDPDPNRSLFFWSYNTNKRSLTLDLEQSGDRERLLRLAITADLLIETFPPGHLEALGLGYDALAARQPRLTVVSITPFGQSGPCAAWRGSDLIGQATGGMVYVNGFAEQPPLQGLGLQAYHSASMYGAIGALLALWARERTGRGQWVDISIQESVAAMVEHASSGFHQDATIARRQAPLHWTRDFSICRCRDGSVVLSTLCDWTSLVEWLKADGRVQDLADPVWDDFAYRREHSTHLFAVLSEWAAGYRVADLIEHARLLRFPWAPVLDPMELHDNPQLADRGFFAPITHQTGETVCYPGAPYRFSRTPWCVRRPPPLVGEHTGDALAQLSGASRTPTPCVGESIPRQGRESGFLLRAADAPSSAETGLTSPFPALHGVRVIDFTWVIAGPVATRILADHGAEVIKIERRDAGDFGTRRGGLSGNLNRGKQSMVIDLNDPRGLELARHLIATADVVVDNFSPRVMRHWGLDYDRLCLLKPDIITLSMSAFGQTGPQRDWVSYGPTLQALAGYTARMRHPGSAPAGWGFSYSDMAAGCSGAAAVLMALWHRRRTGEGQHIDLSQFENLVALLGPVLLETLGGGGSAEPVANRSQEAAAAPHGVYRCADEPSDGPARDRWCAIAVFGTEDWNRFQTALGHPAWIRTDQFATLEARTRYRQELDARVTQWTRGQRAEDAVAALQAAGIAAGVVANAADLCRRDRHLQARGYWVKTRTPEGAWVELDGIPVRLSATPGQVAAPGPLLGEHTDSILERVLGLSPSAIAALRSAGVIA